MPAKQATQCFGPAVTLSPLAPTDWFGLLPDMRHCTAVIP